YAAKIVSFTMTSNSKTDIFELILKNEGNAHCYAMGDFEISDQSGKRVGDNIEFGGEDEFILPGVSIKYIISFPENLPAGKYEAAASLKYCSTAQSLHSSFIFDKK
ncbi:MAG TPA: hypothetical protein VF398_08580, partial [bacterium]